MIETDRETALAALYAADSMGVETPDTEGLTKRAAHLAQGTMQHRTEIDEIISATSESWRLERMAMVDRNILRLAAFELIHTDLSKAVVIDEAVKLAKEYSTASSGSFINGVLDTIASTVRPSS
jgi:N utilization substance protein B